MRAQLQPPKLRQIVISLSVPDHCVLFRNHDEISLAILWHLEHGCCLFAAASHFDLRQTATSFDHLIETDEALAQEMNSHQTSKGAVMLDERISDRTDDSGIGFWPSLVQEILQEQRVRRAV